MKLQTTVWLIVVLLALSRSAFAQDFQNLDFEQSAIVSSSPSGLGFNTGTANVPGWTAYNGWGDVNYSGGTTLIYNNQPLDEPGVALEDAHYFNPAMDGQYSIFLFGGDVGGIAGAAIGQTGQIPLGARSITYWGQDWNSLQITFNGHPLSFSAINTTTSHTTYGADISDYAGQTGELLFSAPPMTGGSFSGMIDNIQFSSTSIPEPSIGGLLAFGGLFFSFRRSN